MKLFQRRRYYNTLYYLCKNAQIKGHSIDRVCLIMRVYQSSFSREVKRITLLTIFVFLALLYFPFSEEKYDPFIARLADAFHLPMGFGISVIWMWVMKRLGFGPLRSGVIVFCVWAVLGGFGELTQPIFGRGCSFYDWLFGVFGLISGISISAILWHGKLKFKPISVWLLGSVLFQLIALIPAYRVFLLVRAHEKIFPRLTDFALAREETLWKRSVGKGSLHIQISDTEFGKSIVFSGKGRGFFGGELSIPQLPWTGYSTLKLQLIGMELAKPEDGRQVIVRVDDCHRSKEYNERYNGAFVLKNGENLISIPLEEIVRARVDPMLDLACIERMVIFTIASGEEFSFGVKNIWLE